MQEKQPKNKKKTSGPSRKEVHVYNLGHLPTAPLDAFQELQEDFKLPDPALLAKLQQLILTRGFKYAFKAWKAPDGQLWIIDAHQRRRALSALRDEGYTIPDIPYEPIQAADRREAVEEIAAYNSRFALENPDTQLFLRYEVGSLDRFSLGFEPPQWGIDLPEGDLTIATAASTAPPLDPSGSGQGDDGSSDTGEDDPQEKSGQDPDDEKKESAEKSFDVLDLLFPSDNDYDIPCLLTERMAGRLELPITPWGANSRLKKGVTTYHFYVDDYRFERLFRDPSRLLTCGCRSIVEPDCSLHDQTPVAWGLQLIYKKRWLARYCQEVGIDIYVDLNVAPKFSEWNLLGVPQGWNAFFTRGAYASQDILQHDLDTARRISGQDTPNLIVYGGGRKAKTFCQQNGLLYIEQFMTAKRE